MVMFFSLINEKEEKFSAAQWVFLFLSPIMGLFIARLLLFLLVMPKQKPPLKFTMICIFKFWTMENIEQVFQDKIIFTDMNNTGQIDELHHSEEN